MWNLDASDPRPVTRFEWAVKCYEADFADFAYLPDLTWANFLKLLNYVTQKWGRLCVAQPNDTNKSRWPLDPLWQTVLDLIAEWSGNYQGTVRREYVLTPDISPEYLMQLNGWLAGFMARLGVKLEHGGPVSLAQALSYLHQNGYTLQELDDKAQEKWEVMIRLVNKGATNG